jgi:hypothetical protein
MSDYSALAQRVSLSVTGIRGCLMLSRDGSVLGAHPEGDVESQIRSAWVRFASVGDPERSYVEFPDQIWAFVRRGGYAAFAVAEVGVRPGVLVDLLEQTLMAGEQERVLDRETMRVPEAPAAPSSKPRTSLHKPERPVTVEPDPAIVASEPAIVASEPATPSPADPPSPEPERAGEGPPGEPEPAAPPESPRPAANSAEAKDGNEDESEVDRILLAKEFAGLLQVPKEDDEASR